MLVYVLSKNGEALMPCSPGKASKLLKSGKAKVVSREPFTIKLLFGSSGYKQPIDLTIDAGAGTIGVAAKTNGKVVYVAEVETRKDISKKMLKKNL